MVAQGGVCTNIMVIQKLTPNQFPSLLKEINDPPNELYIRGNYPDESKKFLAVVGSRKYTDYGRSVIESLLKGLRGYPIVIVSGLALGIDSIAHKAALKADLTTLAIPGSGLDPRVMYPRTHAGLSEDILSADGCLLSEFKPDFRATRWSFPQRNRIMAGVSHAVLVIESTIQSGTLITSKLATDYNRDVLTVPGSIFSKNSEGPHMLLRLGATPIRSSEDILDALDLKSQNTNHESQQKLFEELSEDELRIVKLLREPLSKDELMVKASLPISKINILLSTLELKGILEERLGKINRRD